MLAIQVIYFCDGPDQIYLLWAIQAICCVFLIDFKEMTPSSQIHFLKQIVKDVIERRGQ